MNIKVSPRTVVGILAFQSAKREQLSCVSSPHGSSWRTDSSPRAVEHSNQTANISVMRPILTGWMGRIVSHVAALVLHRWRRSVAGP